MWYIMLTGSCEANHDQESITLVNLKDLSGYNFLLSSQDFGLVKNL